MYWRIERVEILPHLHTRLNLNLILIRVYSDLDITRGYILYIYIYAIYNPGTYEYIITRE